MQVLVKKTVFFLKTQELKPMVLNANIFIDFEVLK